MGWCVAFCLSYVRRSSLLQVAPRQIFAHELLLALILASFFFLVRIEEVCRHHTCREVSWLGRPSSRLSTALLSHPPTAPRASSSFNCRAKCRAFTNTTLPPQHRQYASITPTTNTTTTTGTLAPAAAISALVPNGGRGGEGIVCGVLLLASTTLGLPAINATQVGQQHFTHLLLALLHILAFSAPSRPAASAFQTFTDNSVA